MNRFRALTVACVLLAGSAGCGNNNEELPTTPTPGTTSFTQVFTGTLEKGGSSSFAFSMASSLPVRLSLGSLTDTSDTPLTDALTMSFGRPQGTGCGALQSVTVQAALATQLIFVPASGTYCVGIADPGSLSGTANFGIRITQGDPTSAASPGTDTYSSVLFPGGFTSRTFDASAAGNVTIIMDSLSPANVASLNAGVGFPRSDGGGCNLTKAFVATRGAQLVVPVEIGTYCVKVSDPGTLTQLTQFSMRIVRP